MTATKPKESAAQAEVRDLLTRQQAAERGLIPHGHVFDEETQQAIPLGMAVREDAIRRGEDLERRLQRMARDRKIVLRFIREQMVEAEYDAKGRPIKGKMHDYYILPGYDKKCPTKQGGEKLAQFFNLRRSKTQTVDRVCTAEFTMADVQIELVDRWGMPAGSGEAAATSAESCFQGAAAKYGQRRDQQGKITQPTDWRAAYNDILSRAGKRSFNQAVIYATATDDMFDATGEISRKAEEQGIDDEAPAQTPAAHRRKFPEQIKTAEFKDLAGQYVDAASTDRLVALRNWCAKHKNPAAVKPYLDAIDEVLEARRFDEQEGEEDESPL